MKKLVMLGILTTIIVSGCQMENSTGKGEDTSVQGGAKSGKQSGQGDAKISKEEAEKIALTEVAKEKGDTPGEIESNEHADNTYVIAIKKGSITFEVTVDDQTGEVLGVVGMVSM